MKKNKAKRELRVTDDAKTEHEASAYGRAVLEGLTVPVKRPKARDPQV